MLKVQEIREIIKLIDESTISEFNYETDGTTISLKKGNTDAVSVQQTIPAQIEAPKAVTQPVSEATVAAPQAPEEIVAETEAPEEVQGQVDYDYEITSPMVGTFYSASSPEDDAYVSVGSKVEADSVVCIVEAMKLFNEIEAEAAGEIVEVVATNGELVEYGQPLFRVKKK